MKKTTAGALALTAVTLAGCGDDVLSTEEAQNQLDAAFTEIDALPTYAQDRFQEFSDPDGGCFLAYEDAERGIQIATQVVSDRGLSPVDKKYNYENNYDLPQMVRVDCENLRNAFQEALLTLGVNSPEGLKGTVEETASYHEDALNEFKNRVAYKARVSIDEVTNIQTFGLK